MVLSLLAAVALSTPLHAQDVEAELAFISGLNDLGFPDYAETVLDQIRAKFPRDAVDRAELKVMINQNKLDQALKLIEARGDKESITTWKMWFELAEGYYAWGQAQNFEEIYDRFVKKYSKGAPDEMRDFVVNYSYRYSQLLVMTGQRIKSVEALRTMLKAEPPKHVDRQISIELAELMMSLAEEAGKEERKKLFDEAETIAKKVQWGGQDVWFGRSVVVMAHMRMIAGDRPGARKLILDYLPILKGIHESIKEEVLARGEEDLLRLTPIAQCRFLLGRLHHEEALALYAKAEEGGEDVEPRKLRKKALGHLIGEVKDGKRSKDAALYHLYNVFVKYPSTTWAVEAGRRSNEIIDRLERMGVAIKIEKVDMTEVVAIQFREARGLFAQNNFKDAAEKYREVLNLFPEYAVSLDALGELAEIYIELRDEEYAQLVVEYIADRFGQNPTYASKAGNILVRIARSYKRLEYLDRSNEVYEFFFDRFPDHPDVPRAIFRRGEEFFRQDVHDAAIVYYARIVENYPKSSVYLDALHRIGLSYFTSRKYDEAIAAFDTYLGALKGQTPRQTQIDAMYRVADAYRNKGEMAEASIRFTQVAKILQSTGRAVYETAPSDKERNDALLEGSLFNRANCYARRKQPPAKIPEGRPSDPEYWEKVFKASAIKYYDEYVASYPKTAVAPAALYQMGVLHAMNEDTAKAEAALSRLEKEYPDSEPAKNADYMLAISFLELGRRAKAIQKFKEMFSGDATYSVHQIRAAGEYLYEAAEYDIALDAFNRVLSMSEDDKAKERAHLWLGKVHHARGDAQKAVDSLEEVFRLSPRSAFTVEVSFILGAAYAQLGQADADPASRGKRFEKAFDAIKVIKKYSKTKSEHARADLELAGIQGLWGKKDQALGSYMRVWLLRSSSDPEERPYKEQAFGKALEILLELERWEDVKEVCEEYLKDYSRGQFVREANRGISQSNVNLAPTQRAPVAPETDEAAPVEPAAEPAAEPIAEPAGSAAAQAAE
ncbi:MAG: tetratricopeptide repeat protein [Verrucomicrobia bacterium]|nr:tetratricopeptide repeat protein [Verrucomicrobiota bacterium]